MQRGVVKENGRIVGKDLEGSKGEWCGKERGRGVDTSGVEGERGRGREGRGEVCMCE